jgi:molecular chaperone Hsp33
MKDHMIRILTRDGSLRATAAITTNVVEETRRRQGTDPTATVALGRLVTGAALLGGTLKGDQRLALMVEGNGPLQKLHAETDALGRLRGSVKNPISGLPPIKGRFPVADAVGKAGFLHVTKDLGLKEPYRSMVQLPSGEIAKDLTYYLTVSEQTPSSVGLGVYVEPDGSVSSAGGFLVQALPDADEMLIPLLEERLQDFPPTTTLLREGLGPIHILEQLFAGIPFSLKERTDLIFHCGCSRRQVTRMLWALGKAELHQLQAREEETVVTCEFCKESYRFSRDELAELAELAEKQE